MQDYNRRTVDNDACWLIKVETRVTGPFTFNEVLAKLTTGEIYSHHEVMQSMDRWRSLVAQPLFSAAVEKLKRQMEITPEQTMTRTERAQVTRTLDLQSDRGTPTPFANTITPPPTVPAHPLELPNPSYGSGYPQYRRQTSSSMPLILLSTIAFAAAFAFLFFRKTVPSEPQKQHSSFVGYVDKGLESKKSGDWYEALKNFKLAYQLDPRDLDLNFELAPLLIQVENQSSYGRSLVEKIMVGLYKKENISAGKNILGLSYAYDNQWKSAVKMFKEAIETDEAFLPAQINLGLALTFTGQFKEAEGSLLQALSLQSDSPLAAIYLLESYIVSGQKNNDLVMFKKALQLAGQLASRKIFDGQQELLLMQAYAAFKVSKSAAESAAAQNILLNALVIDPDQTMEHLHSPSIDWRGLNWKSFSFICKDLLKLVKGDVFSQLEFTCTYKLNRETEAQQAVELLMNRQMNTALPHLAQAVVSYRLGEFEKAKDSLTLAQKWGATNKLYLQLLSKTCIKLKDTACLKQNSDNVAKVAPLHAAMAKLYEKSLSVDERNQIIQTGLRESKNYIPLLKMQ